MSDPISTTSTVTQLNETESSLEHTNLGWSLSIVHHTDSAFLGKRVPLVNDSSINLGREERCFGTHALHDSRISRVHARLWVTSPSGPRRPISPAAI